MALTLAVQSTCARRDVGCILVDRHHRIIGSGYNGVAKGLDHCKDKPCGGVGFKSGDGLGICEAIHAEQNALMQCRDIDSIVSAYITTAPCMHCTKMLMNTGCKAIYFANNYAINGKSIWTGKWVKV